MFKLNKLTCCALTHSLRIAKPTFTIDNSTNLQTQNSSFTHTYKFYVQMFPNLPKPAKRPFSRVDQTIRGFVFACIAQSQTCRKTLSHISCTFSLSCAEQNLTNKSSPLSPSLPGDNRQMSLLYPHLKTAKLFTNPHFAQTTSIHSHLIFAHSRD